MLINNSPKEKRRPLPFLLSLSFLFVSMQLCDYDMYLLLLVVLLRVRVVARFLSAIVPREKRMMNDMYCTVYNYSWLYC